MNATHRPSSLTDATVLCEWPSPPDGSTLTLIV